MFTELIETHGIKTKYLCNYMISNNHLKFNHFHWMEALINVFDEGVYFSNDYVCIIIFAIYIDDN